MKKFGKLAVSRTAKLFIALIANVVFALFLSGCSDLAFKAKTASVNFPFNGKELLQNSSRSARTEATSDDSSTESETSEMTISISIKGDYTETKSASITDDTVNISFDSIPVDSQIYAEGSIVDSEGNTIYEGKSDTVVIQEGKNQLALKLTKASSTVTTYTVTFDADGGSAVEAQTVERGNTATKPADPSKSEEKVSYVFLGWYNGDTVFDFATAITENITLKAKWLEGFAKVTGTTIDGDETWTLSSSVFVSERSLTIPDLYVCDHEVTRGEFKEVMGEDPSIAAAYDKDGNELTGDAVLNNPVNYVNWYAAIAYCNKLSVKEGLDCAYEVSGISDWENLEYSSLPTSSNDTWNAATCNFEANGYRLPTEAEWEWLARGGQNYTYAGSDTVDDVAWCTTNTNNTGSRDVKTKAANGYGLYDMSGNVWEWCWDWYVSSISSDTDASGAASGDNRGRRGGSWYGSDGITSRCEVAIRDSKSAPEYCSEVNGFRVVRNAQ